MIQFYSTCLRIMPSPGKMEGKEMARKKTMEDHDDPVSWIETKITHLARQGS